MKKYIVLVSLVLVLSMMISNTSARYDPYAREEPYSCIEDPIFDYCVDSAINDDLVYAELWTRFNNTIDIPASGTYYDIVSINQTGDFSVLEQDTTDLYKINITVDGVYVIDYSISFQAFVNQEYDFGVTVNGATPLLHSRTHRTGGGSAFGVTSLSLIEELDAGDQVWLQVEDEMNPAKDITVKSANLNIHEIGAIDVEQTVIINQTIGGSGSAADVWINETGDDLQGNITVNANLTYWLGNSTNWFGKVYSDIFRGIYGIFGNMTIQGNLDVLGNITGNLSGSNVTLKDQGDFFDSDEENSEDAIQLLASAGGLFAGNTSWRVPVINFGATPPVAPSLNDRYIIAGSDDWYSFDWLYRAEIEINHNNIYKNMTDFPIRIQFQQGHPIFTNAKEDGTDILFAFDNGVDAQHEKILAAEKEIFIGSEEIGVFWVNMSTDDSANQTIFVYYGNAGAAEQYDVSNIEIVWQKNFGAVYHMNSSKPGSFTTPFDSAFESSMTAIPLPSLPTPTENVSEEGYKQYFDGTSYWSMACANCYWEIGWEIRTHTIVFNTTEDITSEQVLGSEGGSVNGWIMYIKNGFLVGGFWSKSTLWPGIGDWMPVAIEPNMDNYVVTTVFNCSLSSGGSQEVNNCLAGNYDMYLNGTLVETNPAVVRLNAHSGSGGIGYTGANTKLGDGIITLTSADRYNGIISEFIVSDLAWDLQIHQTFYDMMVNESSNSVKAQQMSGAGASGDWAGFEGNITQFNESSDWHMIPAENGWATYVTEQMLIYAYDSITNTWSVASEISAHPSLLYLFGCDPDDNECWHLQELEYLIATRPATQDESGYFPAGLMDNLLLTYANMIESLNIGTASELGGGIDDGILHLNLSETWLNETGDVFNGNFSVASGDRIIWSNGTVEVSFPATSVYPGVADDWVNETGDRMTGNLNINDRLLLYSLNGSINTAGDYILVNGDKVIWSNGTVEIGSFTDTNCAGNGTCADIIYSINITGDCPADNMMYGRWTNGTVKCRADDTGSGALRNTETFTGKGLIDPSDPTAPINLTLGGIATGEHRGWQQARAGSITALSVNTDVAMIGGECTFEVMKNGVGIGLTVVFGSSGNNQKDSTTQAVGTDTFVADDIIGVFLVETANNCQQVTNPVASVETYYS